MARIYDKYSFMKENGKERLMEVMARLDSTFKQALNEDDNWIQKAVDPAHKGDCTPMTKDTCTPRRKALAKRFKAGIEDESVMEAIIGDDPEEYRVMVEKLKASMDNLFAEQHFDVISNLYRLIVERKRPLANAPQVNEAYVAEDISIDVEVGDTIMMGRFKNSPTVVKSIGKDEHGMPTINGKKVVTFKKGK